MYASVFVYMKKSREKTNSNDKRMKTNGQFYYIGHKKKTKKKIHFCSHFLLLLLLDMTFKWLHHAQCYMNVFLCSFFLFYLSFVRSINFSHKIQLWNVNAIVAQKCATGLGCFGRQNIYVKVILPHFFFSSLKQCFCYYLIV